MRGLFFILVCGLAASACISADVNVDGWACLRAEDCGTARKYMCLQNQCRVTCQANDDCGAQRECRNGACFLTCEGNACDEPNKEKSPLSEQAPVLDASERAPERLVSEPVEPPPETECTEREERDCFDGSIDQKGVGLCRQGTQACTAGKWGSCVGQVLSQAEVCDGQDNDCNGAIDDFAPSATCKSTDLSQRCLVGKPSCRAGGLICTVPDPGSVTLVPSGAYASEGKLSPCNQATFLSPTSIARDSRGNLLISDAGSHSIFRLTPQNKIELVAGGGRAGAVNGPGSSALFNAPFGLVIDAQNNLYVADHGNSCIRKITAQGMVTTFAGQCGKQGTTDGQRALARFLGPVDLVLSNDALYVADERAHTIRKIALKSGMVTTLSGSNLPGLRDGTGFQAQFNRPRGLALNGTETVLFVADTSNHCIRAIRLADGAVNTVAGGFSSDNKGDYKDAVGKAARFDQPNALLLDANGDLLVSDSGNNVIRRVALRNGSYIVTTQIGVPAGVGGYRDGPRGVAKLNFPAGMVYDAKGQLVFVDVRNKLLRYVNADQVVRTMAGRLSATTSTPGDALCAQISTPLGATLDPSGRLMVLDVIAHTLFRIDIQAGTMTWVAGSFSYGKTNGPGMTASFAAPIDVIPHKTGGFLISERLGHRIRLLENGNVSDYAGDGRSGHANSKDKMNAQFIGPHGMAYNSQGTLFIAGGSMGNTIRALSPTGAVTNFAGSAGVPGGKVGRGNLATFTNPVDIAIDAQDQLFVTDYELHQIRKIDTSGNVSVFAGDVGAVPGMDDGKGSNAKFYRPWGLWWSKAGHLLVADRFNHAIRRVTAQGDVHTIVGGRKGRLEGTSRQMELFFPVKVVEDADGNMFIIEYGDSQSTGQIRMLPKCQ